MGDVERTDGSDEVEGEEEGRGIILVEGVRVVSDPDARLSC